MPDITSIETPAFVIDERIALKNIRAAQAHCDAAGLKLRVHIKTHKLVHFAKAQIAAGAVGINCQKIGEAEVMAEGGLDDILITYNILGAKKLARLKALSGKVKRLSVTADSEEVVAGLSSTFTGAAKPLIVMVECDTGAARCGVQTPEAAAALAMKISGSAGLEFGGFMTYPAVGGAKDVAVFMRKAVELVTAQGLECPEVSSGGTPDMWQAETNGIVSEYRIGTYIYNDRSLVGFGTCTYDDCAGHVVATVVSTPTPDRAIIDAGSKVLTSDLLGFSDYGYVVGYPDVKITALSEEHGTLAVNPPGSLKIGQRLRIVPNHVCVVTNMFDRVWLEHETGDLESVAVDARGLVT